MIITSHICCADIGKKTLSHDSPASVLRTARLLFSPEAKMYQETSSSIMAMVRVGTPAQDGNSGQQQEVRRSHFWYRGSLYRPTHLTGFYNEGWSIPMCTFFIFSNETFFFGGYVCQLQGIFLWVKIAGLWNGAKGLKVYLKVFHLRSYPQVSKSISL